MVRCFKGKASVTLASVVISLLTLGMVITANAQQSDVKSNSISSEYVSVGFDEISSGQTGQVLKKKVDLDFDGVTVMEALEEVTEKSNLKLSYSKPEIDESKRVSLNLRDVTLYNALWKILDGTDLRFAISPNRHLVILKMPTQTVEPVMQGLVKGKVTSAKTGEPLPGANVVIKGTNNGASTDEDGNYVIGGVESGQRTVVANFIGYQKQEKQVMVQSGRKSTVNFQLKEAVSKLDEVTVMATGYQKIPEERSTGSYSTVSKADLEEKPSLDLLSRIEGQTTGLVFNRSSLSDEAQLSIRGRSTIYGEDSPLIVVDGFPIEGDLSSINPNDVESINVLKDAAAASIWGVRAANGVIVIETSGGSYNNAPTVNVQSQYLVGEKPDLSYLPSMSASDWVDLEKRWFENGRYEDYYESDPIQRSPLTPVIETLLAEREGEISSSEASARLDELRQRPHVYDQYSDLFFRNRQQQRHSISISGGSESVRYHFSTDFEQDMSVRKGDSFDRVKLRTDNTFRVTPKLDLNIALNAKWGETQNNSIGLMSFRSGHERGVGIYTASREGVSPPPTLLPYQRLVNDQGDPLTIPREYTDGFKSSREALGYLNWDYRPAEEFGYGDNRTNEQDIRTKVNMRYELFEGLEADLRYQFERELDQTRNFRPTELYYTRTLINKFTTLNPDSSLNRALPDGDILDRSESMLTAHNFRAQLNLDRSFGRKHEVSAVAGTELRDIIAESSDERFYGYSDRSLEFDDVNHTESYPTLGTGFFNRDYPPGQRGLDYRQNRYASFYTNASYTYDRRYVLTASARLDKSSIFGVDPKHRNIPLWSAGLSWNITEEDFFDIDAVSQLKLRTTYGFNGNIDESATAFPTAYLFRDFRTNRPVTRVRGPANPRLAWERQKQINVGLDFGFWDNAIYGTVEGYYKRGIDLLGDQSLDPTTGWTEYRANVANMSGTGYDVELNAQAGGELRWSTKLTFSHSTTEVTHIDQVSDAGIFSNGVLAYMRASRALLPVEGRPVYSVYSLEYAGLDEQGDPQIYDSEGNVTKNYSKVYNEMEPEDLVYHGPANPTYFGGWTHTFQYKGFQLSGTVTYKFGHKFRRSSVEYGRLNQRRSVGHEDWNKRWEEPGDEEHTNVPAYNGYRSSLTGDRESAYLYSDVLIEPGDHIRLKDVTLSYRLPNTLTQKLPLNRVRLYLYAQNLGILWRANDKGIDPEAVNRGFANFLPSPLTFTGGIEIEF